MCECPRAMRSKVGEPGKAHHGLRPPAWTGASEGRRTSRNRPNNPFRPLDNLFRFLYNTSMTKTKTILSIEASHDRIIDAVEAVALADRELAHAVFAARNNGCTWQTIGEDLGVTRSAAWQRFGSKFDTAND